MKTNICDDFILAIFSVINKKANKDVDNVVQVGSHVG